MHLRTLLPLLLLAAAAVPAGAQGPPELPCVPQRPVETLAERASPYDSVAFTVGGEAAVLCYGRPSARERTIMGELVPYGRLWRTGANEPTTLHLPFPARIAGVEVEPGSYSLYTVPGEEEWGVVVNAATSQWGHESRYPSVEAQEVGRGTASVERLPEHVEMFTISAEQVDGGAVHLLLDWENTRVRIPIEAGRTVAPVRKGSGAR